MTDKVFQFGLNFSNPSNYGAYHFYKSNKTSLQYQFATYMNTTSQDVVAYYPQFMYESILRSALDDPNLVFSTTSKTYPVTKILKFQLEQQNTAIIVFAISVAYSIVVTMIVSGVVCERLSGLKHIQMLCGMQPYAYWLSNYVFDLIKLEITILVTIGVFFAFKLEYTAAWVPFLIFPFAILPYSYVCSFIFTSESAA